MKLFAKTLIALLLLCGTAQGSILPWMINSSGQVRLVFHALTYDPVTYELKGVLTGTGDMTVSRTTTQYVLDHEDVYRSAGANSPAYYKGRKVENLTINSNDLSAWATSANKANFTVTTGISDPDGGTNAIRLTVNAEATAYIFSRNLAGAGVLANSSCWIRLVNDPGAVVQLYDVSGIAPVNVMSILTTSWQRLSTPSATSHSLGTYFGVLVGGTTKLNTIVEIYKPQAEIVAGSSTPDIPSEYVASGATAVTKWYANTNGNTVASNVVTEATGTLLSPLPMLQVDPALTNSLTYSRDLTNAAWTASASMTTAYTSTGLQGAANTATRLTAGDANQTVIRASAVAAASATHAAKFFIRRITGTGTIELTLDNGSTWQDITASVGATYGEGIPIEQATLENPQVGIRIVTSGDAVDVGNAELFTAKTIAGTRGAGPIFTTTAAVTTGAQTGSFDSANISDTSGLITFRASTDGANNFLSTFIGHDGTNVSLADGTTTDTAVAAVGTTHKIGVWWHGAQMGLCLNGTCNAAVAYDGTMLSGNLDAIRTAAYSGLISDVKGYQSGNATSYAAKAVEDTTP